MNAVEEVMNVIKTIAGINEEKVILTDEFQKAYDLMEETTNNIYITGKAGTGKSTLITYFREHTKKKIVILAPTGLAAINVGGQTIHSFFYLPPRFITAQAIRKINNPTLYRNIDLIIIDEISMVRADVLDGIDYFLRLHGKDKNQPFGGIQIIMVGDLYQLPPIVTREDSSVYHQYYDTPYFFSSGAFTSTEFQVIELTTNFRQQDAEFLKILNQIRIGEVTSETLAPINQRTLTETFRPNRNHITLATTNNVANAINQSELNHIGNPGYSYTAVIEGQFPTEERNVPADLVLTLKVGARVMFVKNDKAHQWVNGSLGTIHHLEEDLIQVKLDNDIIVNVQQEAWEYIKYEYNFERNEVRPVTLGKLQQYPLRLAWAITIHKSQGMTFDKVHLDFTRSPFAHGQTYVALSRCKTIEGLSLTKNIWPNDVIVDERITSFMQRKRY